MFGKDKPQKIKVQEGDLRLRVNHLAILIYSNNKNTSPEAAMVRAAEFYRVKEKELDKVMAKLVKSE